MLVAQNFILKIWHWWKVDSMLMNYDCPVVHGMYMWYLSLWFSICLPLCANETHNRSCSYGYWQTKPLVFLWILLVLALTETQRVLTSHKFKSLTKPLVIYGICLFFSSLLHSPHKVTLDSFTSVTYGEVSFDTQKLQLKTLFKNNQTFTNWTIFDL